MFHVTLFSFIYRYHTIRYFSVVPMELISVVSLYRCVVTANETEMAFFSGKDYGLFKANPETVW